MFWIVMYRVFMGLATLVFVATFLSEKTESSLRMLALGLSMLSFGLAIKPLPSGRS